MRVLMIGNSYTFYHDMPSMLSEELRSRGVEAEVVSVTKGGRRLIENLTPGDEQGEAIRAYGAEGGWDVLILQGHSVESILGFEELREGVLGLSDLIRAKRTLLYVTWSRHPDHPLLAEQGWTYAEMTEKIAAAYETVAAAAGAACCHVGRAFSRYVAEGGDPADLYFHDLHHSSPEGSRLAARTLADGILSDQAR